ncbi:MAG: hypothetical protein NC823_01700 [Candidatus Omnitrophica bacterium]|nr:hypothetical protein [Candidatus Omnitrophota bacterium]
MKLNQTDCLSWLVSKEKETLADFQRLGPEFSPKPYLDRLFRQSENIIRSLPGRKKPVRL